MKILPNSRVQIEYVQKLGNYTYIAVNGNNIPKNGNDNWIKYTNDGEFKYILDRVADYTDGEIQYLKSISDMVWRMYVKNSDKIKHINDDI